MGQEAGRAREWVRIQEGLEARLPGSGPKRGLGNDYEGAGQGLGSEPGSGPVMDKGIGQGAGQESSQQRTSWNGSGEAKEWVRKPGCQGAGQGEG